MLKEIYQLMIIVYFRACCGSGACQVVLVVKNPSANAGDVREVNLIPGLGRFPGGITTYSSIRAWRIPCTEEPGGLQSIGLQRVGHH